ncbi:MAG: glycosyltransferase [Actinomycetales bacterium]|nr:glycosyltransferase [Actinomycetales bacterium]
MRIAHVSDCYLPRTGGIETQVRALALRQAAAGMDVRIITATPGQVQADGVIDAASSRAGSSDESIPIHRLAMQIPFDLPIHLRTRREVMAVLADHPVDVVHVHAGVVSPFAWGAVRAAARMGLPTLVTVHSIWGSLARPGFALSDALLRWSAWGVQLSAVSEVAARQVSRALPSIGPVLVLPNGIDPGPWQVEHRTGRAGELRVVTVMRLAPRKRLLPLLRILRSAAARLGDRGAIRATIVGDGPERARAERYAQRHRMQVTFTGRMDRDGIRERFAESDAYVQPSVKESFGIAALEGRSAGLPVIARRESGTSAFVRDGVEGLLVDSDDAMADGLVRLAIEPGLVRRMREHNRTVPPEQSWEHVLELVQEAYATAIARRGA